MPCLRQLLAGLMLFCFTAAYHGIATPEQVEKGQVEGFTGLSDVEPTCVSLSSLMAGYTVLTSKILSVATGLPQPSATANTPQK